MTSSTQILPSLVFLFLGGVGLLWLAEPPRVGAAAAQPTAEPPAAQPARIAKAPPARAPHDTPNLRWPGAPRSAPSPASAAPALTFGPERFGPEKFGPEKMAELRQRIADQKAERRREVLRERRLSEDAWFSERARQLAQDLELPPGSDALLRGLYIQERDRQTEVWERVRAIESREESRRMLRAEMLAVLEWRQQELERLLGPEAAERVVAAENEDLSEGDE